MGELELKNRRADGAGRNPLAPPRKAKEVGKAVSTSGAASAGPGAASAPAPEKPSAPGISLSVTADRKPKPPQRAAKSDDKGKAERSVETAKTITTALESGAVIFVGDEARMNSGERKAIEGPLARVVERLPDEVQESVNTWTDPVALAIGLFAWLARVVQLAQVKAAEQIAAEEAARASADPFGIYPPPDAIPGAPDDLQALRPLPPDETTVRAAFAGGS
jgi:hypothetical protein